MVMSEVEHRM